MQQVQHIISFHGNLPSHMNAKDKQVNDGEFKRVCGCMVVLGSI